MKKFLLIYILAFQQTSMYLLGYDIGSSSIKVALVEVGKPNNTHISQSPSSEMEISAPHQGWAEQDPETWWKNVCTATQKLLEQSKISPEDIKGIGISYQMHGLVLVSENHKVLRPSIIWCDGRAVQIGKKAFDEIGHKECQKHLLNSPGNFTASKLKWVKDNEPFIYEKSYKMMLPGDYIAMRLTNEISTTASGLSEAILWDFHKNAVAKQLLDHLEINENLIPSIHPTFSIQGQLSSEASKATGLSKGTPVSYRAGDQPNNAMSLNVLEPGEIAATGGTSGVVYGIVDKPVYDPLSRVNGFAHVNHQPEDPRIGILLCINGSGIQYAWIRHQFGNGKMTYKEMEILAESVPVGSDGLRILPFGNGAERMLNNLDIGSKISNLHFNRHSRKHLIRAALEGIAFSFVYGTNILKGMGLDVQVLKVGNDNLFQSKIFSTTISNLIGAKIQMVETTGAVGAANAAGVATGIYSSLNEAMEGGCIIEVFEPDENREVYKEKYGLWEMDLKSTLK